MNLLKLFKVGISALVFSPCCGLNSAIASSIDLKSYQRIGAVSTVGNELQISTATGARSVSEIELKLSAKLTPGTEGSAATFFLESGTYNIKWQFYTEEKRPGYDFFSIWNGETMRFLVTASAARPISNSAGFSLIYTNTFYTKGKISLIAMDTGDKAGKSVAKIFSIEKRKIPESSNILGIVAIGIILMKRR